MEINQIILDKGKSLIAALMKDFRQNKSKKSVLEISTLMKVERQYIYQLESGKVNFSIEVFLKYCIAVGAKPTISLLNEKEFVDFSKIATEKGLIEVVE